MKADRLYQELKDLAEKLEITVSEKNLRNAGLPVKSGLCRVNGRQLFVMDKHLSLHKKNNLLSACLAGMDHENLYIVPAVRDFIEKAGEKEADET
mgnify:CR=1 FL=1